MNAQTIPGAIDVNGIAYFPGSKGTLVPVANVKAQDLIQNEMVYKLTDYALDLSAEIARFNAHSRADLAEFDAILAQEYGLERDPESKGNRTYRSADGKRAVKYAVAERIAFGPELQIAKELLAEIVRENAPGTPPVLQALVNLAFKVDKEGNVDMALLLAISRLEVDHPRWPDITRAIKDSMTVIDTTSYVRFYAQGPDGKDKLIPIDIASAHPTPEAFERRSLRRQVEELTAELQQAHEDIIRANALMEDDLYKSAGEVLSEARDRIMAEYEEEVA